MSEGDRERVASRRPLRRALDAFLLALAIALASGILAFASTWRAVLSGGTPGEVGRARTAIVLGAAAWGNRPSPAFRERIEHAVRLWRAGDVDMVIFTGAIGQEGEPAEAEVARRHALATGLPPEVVRMETRSRDTRENLRNARELLVAERRWREPVRVVTDPPHMERATVMARDLGLDAVREPTSTTVFRSWSTRRPFVLRETWYLLRYRILRALGRFDDEP